MGREAPAGPAGPGSAAFGRVLCGCGPQQHLSVEGIGADRCVAPSAPGNCQDVRESTWAFRQELELARNGKRDVPRYARSVTPGSRGTLCRARTTGAQILVRRIRLS